MFLPCIISQVLTPVEQSSSASTTLAGTERESSSLGKWCFAHQVLADCMRQPEILVLFISSVSVDLGLLQPFALTDFGAGSRSSFQQSDSLVPEVMLKPK